MMKFKKSIFICMLVSISMIFLSACGNSGAKEIKVESIAFAEPVIDLFVGESYGAEALIFPSDATNKKILYSFENPKTNDGGIVQVLKKIKDNKFLAVKEGEATIIAISQKLGQTKKVTQRVRVFNEKVTLNTPTGLRYDGSKVVWDKVQYKLLETDYDAFGYVVNLNGEDLPVNSKTEFTNLPVGIENKIKIKACEDSSSVINDSNYSSEISVYILNAPTNITRVGNLVSWDAVEFAGSYDIYINGELYIRNITDTSAVVDFEQSGKYALTIVANPENNNDFKYSSKPSERISIEKLDKVETVTLNNYNLSWNEVVKAVEYKVVLENERNTYSFNSGVYTVFDLRDVIDEIESGDYELSIVAVSNTTSGINSNNSAVINVTKLESPTNMRVENNKLVWDMNENAIGYSVSVNDGELISVTDSYSLPEDSLAGCYKFRMIAYGDGTRYLTSSLTASDDAFETYKLEAPTSISNNNNTIFNSVVENAVSYAYYDVADESNIIEMDNDCIIDSGETENGVFAKLSLQDKITIEDMAEVYGDLDKSYLYYRLLEELDKNFFEIKVKAIGENGGNYFDSSLSECSVSFYKLFAPLWLSKVPAYFDGVSMRYDGFTMIWDSTVLTGSGKSKELYDSLEKLTYDSVDHLIAKLRFAQIENGKLVERFIHVIDGKNDDGTPAENESITREEFENVKGGDILVSLAFKGNGTTIIDSDFTNLTLASNWTLDLYSGNYSITDWSEDELIVGRMHEPTNLSVSGTSLMFNGEGSGNENFVLYIQDAFGHYHLVGETTQNSFDLDRFIPSSDEYNLVIFTEPTDNTDYSSSVVIRGDTIYGTAAFEQDKFNYSSKEVEFKVSRIPAPEIYLDKGYICWNAVEGAIAYSIYVNGVKVQNPTIVSDENDVYSWYCDIYDKEITSIKVRAIAPVWVEGEDFVIDSKYSNDIDYGRIVLDSYTIDNDLLTIVTNVENVELCLSVNDEENPVNIQNFVVDDLSINLTNLIKVAGNYRLNFYVKLKDTAEQNKLNSREYGIGNEVISVKVLSNPVVTYNSSTYEMSWRSVTDATGYRVAYRELGSEEVYFSSVITGNSFDLKDCADFVENVIYEVTLISVGEQGSIISSYPNFAKAVQFERMARVSNFAGTVESNKYVLTWDSIVGASYDVYLDDVLQYNVTENVFRYTLNSMTEVKQYNFTVITKNKNNEKAPSLLSNVVSVVRLPKAEVELTDGVVTISNYDSEVSQVHFYITNSENVKVYEATVQSAEIDLDEISQVEQGNYSVVINFVGDGVNYINGAEESIKNLHRQARVQNVSLISKQIVWTPVEDVLMYKVIFTTSNNEKVVRYVSKKSVEIPDELSSGTNTVVICCVGDDDNTLTSLASEPLAFEKLESPENVVINNGVLTFDKVDNFENYLIVIEKTNDTHIIEFTYDNSGSELDFNGVGVYNISVITCGNYVTSVDSSKSECVTIIKLDVPNAISVENDCLIWDEVENVVNYAIKLSGAGDYNFVCDGNSLSLNPRDLSSGTYNVQIVSVGNGENILNSVPKQESQVFTILQVPQNLGFDANKKFVWSEVDNATGYTVELIYGNDISQFDTITNSFDIPNDIVSGDYRIRVTAIGNGLNIINSKASSLYEFTKLPTPNTITHQSKVVTIETIANISNYDVLFEKEDGSIITLNVTSDNPSVYFGFDSSGVYSISYRCAGDYQTTIDSDLSTPIEVRKLDLVDGVTVNNGVVSWNENEFATMNNFAYELIVVDSFSSIVYKNETKDTSLSFDVDSFGAGLYTVKIRVLAGNKTEFLPSEPRIVADIDKFTKPQIENGLSNNKIVWSLNLNETEQYQVTGFIVKVVDTDGNPTYVKIDDPNQNSIELGERYDAGRYWVSVKVLGDGQSFINSLYSDEKEVVKLNSTQIVIKKRYEDASISDYIATWENVDNASSYVVTFNGNNHIETTNNYVVLDNCNYLVAGLNTIRVKALGDNSQYLASKSSTTETFNVLNYESLYAHISQGIIEWQSIDNAKLYVLEINGQVVNCGDNTSYELAESFNAGNYTIKIKAIAVDELVEGEIYVNSLYSQGINCYKLQAPEAIKVVDGKFRFSVVEYRNMADYAINRLTYRIQYGNNDEIIVLNKQTDLTRSFYSDRVGMLSDLRYKAIGDSYNLNSDWSTPTMYGIELPNVDNLSMSNGVLSWDAVVGATKYLVEATRTDSNGENSEQTFTMPYQTSTILNMPFYDSEYAELGASFKVKVTAIGTEDSTGETNVYTNSKGEYIYITYLPRATDVATKNGLLNWSGESPYSYELEIDGNVRTIYTKFYNFESEGAGKHIVRVRLNGNSTTYVNGVWSEYATIYKIGTPTAYGEMYLVDGNLAWSTSKSFLDEYGIVDLQNVDIFKYVDIMFTGNNIETFTINRGNIVTELDGDVYKTILYTYFDDIVDAGTYSIRLRNYGSNGTTDTSRFINSGYSNAFMAMVLPYPKNVEITNGILRWQNVENNNGYIVYISKEDGSTERLMLPKTQNQDLCYVDLRSYSVGTYSFTVRAIGDSLNYISSSISDEVKVRVLSAPESIDMYEGLLSWTSVEGAIGYNVKIVNTINDAETVFENIEFIVDDERVYFELPESVVAGTYNVSVMSVGNNSDFITSKYMTNPKEVTKISPLENFGNTLGKLSFKQASARDKLITGYEINVKVPYSLQENNEFTIKAYTIPKDNSSATIKVVNGVCYYELPEDIPEGELIIKVKALGDYENIANSSYTEEMTATKLGTINNLSIRDGVINWTYDNLGKSGFYLVVGDGETAIIYEDNLITTYSTEFPSNLPADSYNVYIKVVGNTVTQAISDKRYLNSNISSVLQITKLGQVNGFTVQDGVFVWDKVNNATSYELTFYKENQNNITVQSATFNSSLNKYYFAPLGLNNQGDLRFTDGKYNKITIRALGGQNNINSQTVELNNIYKIKRPSSITLTSNNDELNLSWQIISYTDSNGEKVYVKDYRIKLVSTTGSEIYEDVTFKNAVNSDITFLTTDLNKLFTIGASKYVLSIQALAMPEIDGQGNRVWNTINSDFSETLQVTKPDTPKNLRFDDSIKAFTWDRPPLYDESNEYYTASYVYDVTYIYKQSELSTEYEFGTARVTTERFYPSKLGVYYVIVRAVVAGSLTSDYVGARNIEYLSVRMEEDESISEQTSLINFINNYGVMCRHNLFESGEGTYDSPYIIKNATQFNNMNYYYIEDVYFELANNIDLGYQNVSIGSSQTPFGGNFNGKNYRISNFTMNNSSNDAMGLFAYARYATIKNVILVNANISISRTSNTYAGLLVGYAEAVNIENILINSGSIVQNGTTNTSPTFYIGGVVGYACGYNSDINIYAKNIKNYANIMITGVNSSMIAYCGGIAGYFESSYSENYGIINCANEGSISGTVVGGLVGYADCAISNSYNAGEITGYTATASDSYAGGLVGRTGTDNDTIIIVTNTYNIGDVNAYATQNKNAYSGGLLGYGHADIYNFYNSGNVLAYKNNVSVSNAGWLTGYNYRSNSSATKCYTINTSLTTNSGNNTVAGECINSTPEALNSAVEEKLSSAFSYSAIKGRIILNMENTLLG